MPSFLMEISAATWISNEFRLTIIYTYRGQIANANTPMPPSPDIARVFVNDKEYPLTYMYNLYIL